MWCETQTDTQRFTFLPFFLPNELESAKVLAGIIYWP